MRTRRIPALAAVAWLTGVVCCAAEANFLQPPSPPLGPEEMRPGQEELSVEEPTPECWPAGTIEPEGRRTLFGLIAEEGVPLLAIPAIPDLSLTPPPSRTFGPGHPVAGTSWRNRPWYIGGFFGPMIGDDPIDGVLEQDVGIVGGARFGYDLDYYFAAETNLALAIAAIDDGHTPPPGRDGETVYIDGRMLLYPWGDSQWRPFYAIGAGVANVHWEDAEAVKYRESLFQLPLSIGVKYLYDRWFAFRAELTHHVVFGAAGLDTMDNFAATAGFEIRYGAQPRRYFPW